MARVTKINVGGTNYDIAHEGALKNSGFEVVSSLPTTGLFEGREVMYNGQLYVYNGSQWVNVNAPYEAKLKWGGDNFSDGYSPLDAGLIPAFGANRIAFLPPENIDVEYSRDGGNSWLEYNNIDQDKRSLTSNYESRLYIGNYIKDHTQPTADYQLRVTINAGTQVYSMIHKLAIRYSTKYSENVIVSVSASKRNSTDFTELTNCKLTAFPGYSILNFNTIYFGDLGNFYNKLRLTFTNSGSYGDGFLLLGLGLYGGFGWYAPSNLAKIGTIYSFDEYGNVTFPASVNSKETVNFDVNNIEPTQTGNVTKTSTWLWQYLVQCVNWLKANKVALSVYNAKVAALEQADTDNNASIQSVSTDLTELSNGLATVATSGSYNDLTDTPTLAAVATSGDYNDLLNNPALVFSNIGGTISSVQIPDGLIANSKLSNSSMSLNDTTVNLGDTAILPWYIDYNEVDYPARIRDHWLQIYRNGVWANLMYLGDILPTQVGQITSLDNLDWYNEQVSEYEVDSNTTISILNGTTKPATLLLNCLAERLTINLYPISGKQYGKGSLDSLISDLQGKGFSVFVENDLDAILASGSNYLVRIKISKVPTTKAIIECYIAR